MTTPLGNLIRSKRADKRITQELLAELVDVEDRQVKRWESGENAPERFLPRVVEVLNITAAELAQAIADAPRSLKKASAADVEEVRERLDGLVVEVADLRDQLAYVQSREVP